VTLCSPPAPSECHLFFDWPLRGTRLIGVCNTFQSPRKAPPQFAIGKRLPEKDSNGPFSPWVGKKRKRAPLLQTEENSVDNSTEDNLNKRNVAFDWDRLKRESTEEFDWDRLKRASTEAFDWDRLKRGSTEAFDWDRLKRGSTEEFDWDRLKRGSTEAFDWDRLKRSNVAFDWDRLKRGSTEAFDWDRLKRPSYDWDRLKRAIVAFDWDRLKRPSYDWDRLKKRPSEHLIGEDKKAKPVHEGFLWDRV